MSGPGKYNLEVYRGDTYGWRFLLWADDERTDPVDLTGAVAKSEVRDKSAGAVVAELAATITLPNIIDVTLAADQWAELPAKGVWDLQVTWAGPPVRVLTPIGGTFTATPDVTDSTTPPARRT